MCYSKEVSITTYGIGSITSLLLYNKDNISLKISGLFFLFVTQMQLIDYFIWKNKECNNFNKDVSHIGAILNHMQPIVLYLLVKYYNLKLNEINKNMLDLIFIIYITALLNYNKYIYPIECTEVTDDSKPYLRWDWNFKKNSGSFYLLFVIALSSFMYYGLEKPYNIIISFSVIITFILSYIITKGKKQLGLIWCWISAILPLMILIVEYLIKNNKIIIK
jgi:hypothetical protein